MGRSDGSRKRTIFSAYIQKSTTGNIKYLFSNDWKY